MGPLGVLVDGEVGNATSRPFRGEGGRVRPKAIFVEGQEGIPETWSRPDNGES